MKRTSFPTLAAVPAVIMAAALFGASAPLAKLLLGEVAPVPLAALLYLGSGLGLAVFGLAQKAFAPGKAQEARIEASDLPWLGGAVLAGGVLAPILLMVSLNHTPGATASLLLNFEAVATTLIAAVVFKEAIGRPVGWAIALITAAGILLTWQPDGGWGISMGALGVAGACFLWGIDNNLTRHISAKDPLSIVTWKGLGAGLTSLVIGMVIGQPFPALRLISAVLALGFFSYGFSIVLFIRAMRSMGAARTSAFFGVAPFVGALIALALFRETPTVPFLLAVCLMAAGAYMIFRENHEHRHQHDAVEHEHAHEHDDHHQHAHLEIEPGSEDAHSHRHTHQPLHHNHHHLPDIHHWHEHEAAK